MKISSLNAHAFGKLKDVHFKLGDGLNVITGANESGKSSVARLIRFLFYGYTSPRAGSLSENDKRLYTPWDNTASSGELDFSVGDTSYTLRREQTARASHSVTSSDGAPAFTGSVPGEAVFGVNADTFDKTAFIGKGDVFFDDGASLVGAIKNMVFSADSAVDSDAALKKLDTLRRSILGKTERSGRLYEARGELAELEARQTELVGVHKELLGAAASLERVRAKLVENRAALERLEKEQKNLEAFAAKGLCEKLNAAEQTEKDCRAAFEACRMELCVNGFVPDRGYLSLLNNALVELERADMVFSSAQNERAAAESALAAAFTDADQRTFNAALDQSGKTPEEILSDIAVVQKKRKTYQTLTVVFAVLVVTFPLAIFFGMRAKKLRKELENVRQAFGCDSLAVFEHRLNNYHTSSKTAADAKERLEKAESLLDKALQNRGACADALCALLEKTGLGVTYSDTSSLASAAKEHICGLDADLTKLEALDGALSKASAALEGLLAGIRDKEALFALADTYSEEIPLRENDKVLREIDFYRRANEGLAIQEREFEKKAAVIAGNMEKPDFLAARISLLKAEIDELSQKKEALDMAVCAIEKAHQKMRSDVSPLLSRRASELFCQMTDGKYQGLYIDSSLKLTFLEKGSAEYRDVEYLSTGTLDAAYLCLRITLAEYLYTEPPVLIFDDAFAHFDDTRLANTLAFLKILAEKYQILILSCTTREADMLQEAATRLSM